MLSPFFWNSYPVTVYWPQNHHLLSLSDKQKLSKMMERYVHVCCVRVSFYSTVSTAAFYVPNNQNRCVFCCPRTQFIFKCVSIHLFLHTFSIWTLQNLSGSTGGKKTTSNSSIKHVVLGWGGNLGVLTKAKLNKVNKFLRCGHAVVSIWTCALASASQC